MPEEGKEEVGAGKAGTGSVAGRQAGRQLAGKVVPAETTSSPARAWGGGGGEGRGRAQPGWI